MEIVSIPSPNFTGGRRNFKPEAIVIHIMEGTLAGTDSWFQNRQSQVSAHYGIGKTGDVHRYVNEMDTAWHAGRVNAPSWPLIKPTGNGNYINPNYYTIGIEHEGNENTDWTDAMYLASADLVRDISERLDIPLDRNHVIGHHEIYSLKTCPGNKVDLNRLISQASSGNFVGPQLAVNPNKVAQNGKVTTIAHLNIRKEPKTLNAPFASVPPGIQLAYDGYVLDGESVNGNSRWYFTDEGNWFWSGAVK